MALAEVIKFVFGIITLILALSGGYYAYSLSKTDNKRARQWKVLSLGFTVGFFLYFVRLVVPYLLDVTGFLDEFLIPGLSLALAFTFFFGVYSMAHHQNNTKKKTISEVSLFVNLAAAVIFSIALIVVIGWIYKMPSLTSLTSWSPSMVLSTALCFIACSIVLALMNCCGFNARPIVKVTINVLLVFVLILMFSFIFVAEGSALIEKSWLYKKPSLGTISAFLLFCFAGFRFNFVKKSKKSIRYSGVALVVLASVAVLGDILTIPEMYYNFPSISGGMAIHTAVIFMIMGTSLILISAKRET